MSDTLSVRLASLKERARRVVGARRDRRELYGVLADCARICSEYGEEEVRRAFVEKFVEGGGRRYVERGTDVYGVVARVVFQEVGVGAGRGRSDVVWRYGAALRQAAEMQIRWDELAGWLEREGGVSTLWARWREQRLGPGAVGGRVVVKITLDRGLELKVGEWTEVRLRLRDGVGSVVEWQA